MTVTASQKIVVGSLNLQGVKNTNNSTRLRQMLAAAKRAKIDVLLAQEHNITAELARDAEKQAHKAGFCLALGFCPVFARTVTRGEAQQYSCAEGHSDWRTHTHSHTLSMQTEGW